MFPFKRILKSGIKNFKRQANLSWATSLVLVIALCLVSFLFLGQKTIDLAIEEIREKADISVYLKDHYGQDDAFALKERLEVIEGVEEVEYVSEEEALNRFIEKHKEDQALMESLLELGANPFLASLSIRSSDSAAFDRVNQFLEEEDFSGLVEKVDYFQRKLVIDKLFKLAGFLNQGGVAITGILLFVSLLFVFNTIRLTICSQEQEISIMRLVGASNCFVAGPFLIQGLLAGLLALIVSLGLVLFSSWLISAKITVLFLNFDLFFLFKSSFGSIVFIQLACALFLGVVPSLIAIRKFLEV